MRFFREMIRGSGGCFSQMSQKTKDTDFSAKSVSQTLAHRITPSRPNSGTHRPKGTSGSGPDLLTSAHIAGDQPITQLEPRGRHDVRRHRHQDQRTTRARGSARRPTRKESGHVQEGPGPSTSQESSRSADHNLPPCSTHRPHGTSSTRLFLP
jgi:hypothetical protein